MTFGLTSLAILAVPFVMIVWGFVRFCMRDRRLRASAQLRVANPDPMPIVIIEKDQRAPIVFVELPCYPFRKGSVGDDNSCSICLGEYAQGVDVRAMPCAHVFHRECIDLWLKAKATCPLCKYDVSSACAPTPADTVAPLEPSSSSRGVWLHATIPSSPPDNATLPLAVEQGLAPTFMPMVENRNNSDNVNNGQSSATTDRSIVTIVIDSSGPNAAAQSVTMVRFASSAGVVDNNNNSSVDRAPVECGVRWVDEVDDQDPKRMEDHVVADVKTHVEHGGIEADDIRNADLDREEGDPTKNHRDVMGRETSTLSVDTHRDGEANRDEEEDLTNHGGGVKGNEGGRLDREGGGGGGGDDVNCTFDSRRRSGGGDSSDREGGQYVNRNGDPDSEEGDTSRNLLVDEVGRKRQSGDQDREGVPNHTATEADRPPAEALFGVESALGKNALEPS
eukprot:CAMPEP_0184650318 /NCGR_PEP_ID=MMETSP0308-20130426/7841_1 /TAXON_ID=38269 /ORGANISM="Gloeochaete witrockiana, Strain SAG 46.84" /LENGTH=448 /DNA_ID=CAMNT_0027083753 /DNA_START=261 /DNA_END=1607 /DNA_ORIENTATION=+